MKSNGKLFGIASKYKNRDNYNYCDKKQRIDKKKEQRSVIVITLQGAIENSK